jgi:hypothetical protein
VEVHRVRQVDSLQVSLLASLQVNHRVSPRVSPRASPRGNLQASRLADLPRSPLYHRLLSPRCRPLPRPLISLRGFQRCFPQTDPLYFQPPCLQRYLVRPRLL